MKFKKVKQRGQVLVFYALMIPILLLFAGVGLDLGWYYLNVSRLQNAADAAVLAGAHKLNDEHDTFKNKHYQVRLVHQYPADKRDNTTDTTEGDKIAADSTLKNLSSDFEWQVIAFAPLKKNSSPQILFSVAEADENPETTTESTSTPPQKSYSMNDNWSIRGDPQVTMTPSLYKDGKDYYYVVHLKEDIHHFFLGFYDEMAAPVVAVAKLEKNPIRTIIYDANGGNFTKGGVDTTDQPKDEVLIGSGTTIGLLRPYEMYHKGFDFKNVWCTTPDGTGQNYYKGENLKKRKWMICSATKKKSRFTLCG